MKPRIAVVIGSLREESLTKQFAQQVMNLAKDSFAFEIIALDIPGYNPDREDTPPQERTALREGLKRSQGVRFFTPEYNRSLPGILKNALDVGSRPRGENARENKIGGVLSITPGDLGGFGANSELRHVASILNIPFMPQPEGYIREVSSLFGEDDQLNEQGRKYAQEFLDAYRVWFEKLSG